MMLIVFDLYGTLIRAREDFPPTPEGITSALVAAKVEPDLAAKIATDALGRFGEALLGPSLVQTPTARIVESVCRDHGSLDLIGRLRKILWQLIAMRDPTAEVYPGAVSLLQSIIEAGHRARILSNCVLPPEEMDAELSRAGLARWVECSRFSSAGGVRKPHPDAFRAIGGDVAVDEIVMVGDDEGVDLAPAAALGWHTVLVGAGAGRFAPLRDFLDIGGQSVHQPGS